MTVKTVTVGPLGTNCYVITDDNGTAVVIDPGAEAERISETVQAQGATLRGILLTHVHFDHVGALEKLATADVPIYCHGQEAAALTDGRRNLSAVFGTPLSLHVPVTAVDEGDTIAVGDLCFTVWHTPGHTPGSVCYAIEDVLFSGDTLFCESVGRTDFPGGHAGDMVRSLRRLLNSEGDRRVFPGHEEPTTLAHERQYNPYAGM